MKNLHFDTYNCCYLQKLLLELHMIVFLIKLFFYLMTQTGGGRDNHYLFSYILINSSY